MKEKIGNDFYHVLKKNNKSVWTVFIISAICCIGSLVFAWKVYQNSANTLFTVNTKGDLIPLQMLDQEEAQLIEAKATIELFIDLYYSLNAYNMKTKKERVLWLVGKQPTEIIKDRNSKGYFDTFLTMSGLTQNAELLQNTLKISKKEPYEASFTVRIERVNAGVSNFYNAFIKLKMNKVNRNYPYNPHGFLITQFSESLEKINTPEKEVLEKEKEESEEVINQNPKNDGGTSTGGTSTGGTSTGGESTGGESTNGNN